GTDNASVQQLHSEAAWALFAQNKTQGIEEHLIVMRPQSGLARMANMIDGMLAVRDGRLELGVKNLKAAQQDQRYARSMLPLMGLARAYEGLGLAEPALNVLQRLESAYKNFDSLSDEEHSLAAEFFPNAESITLETLRCQLALNQMEAALASKKRLAGRPKRPQELAARMLIVNHYLAAGQPELAKRNPLDACDAARAELKAVPQAMQKEPVVVWADAMLTASQPESRPSQAPRSGPSNADKAEQILKDYVAARRDFDSHLLWVRWLENRQRF